MRPVFEHSWDLTPDEAQQLQIALAARVVQADVFMHIDIVAGVDVAYTDDNVFAAVVTLRADSLSVIETATAIDTPRFPYLPGLFSFRELPAIIRTLARLTVAPDLIICDGHGIAHPRRCGLASHLGLLYDLPTIGCAKSNLYGEYTLPGENRGDYTAIRDDDEIIGRVLRTQQKVKPVFVSVGHNISLSTACNWVLHCAPTYRLPETTRYADKLANEFRAESANR